MYLLGDLLVFSSLGRDETLLGPLALPSCVLTLNAEAKLLLLVGDVAGYSSNQSHGKGTGHTRDGASLC